MKTINKNENKTTRKHKKDRSHSTANSAAAPGDRRGTWVYLGFSVYPEHALSAGHVPSAGETGAQSLCRPAKRHMETTAMVSRRENTLAYIPSLAKAGRTLVQGK